MSPKEPSLDLVFHSRDLAEQLDETVAKRGFKNRSQAVTEMVRNHLAELKAEAGTETMAGTISLVYDYRKRNLQTTLSEIQHRYYLLIVTSMHVHLEHHNYSKYCSSKALPNSSTSSRTNSPPARA